MSLVAQRFSENNIPVVSNEGLLINSSEKVRFLVAIMRYLLDKADNLSKAAICEYLQSESPINYTLHEIHLLLKKEDGFIDLLNKMYLLRNSIVHLMSLLNNVLYIYIYIYI